MPAAYPIPTSMGGASSTAPLWTLFYEAAPDFPVDEQVNQDGSADRLLWADEQTRTFYFTYEDLTEARAAILDAHYTSATGEFDGFDFHQPRTAENLTNVHYKEYKRSNSSGFNGRYFQNRTVVLIKRPV